MLARKPALSLLVAVALGAVAAALGPRAHASPGPYHLVASDKLTSLDVTVGAGASPGVRQPTIVVVPGWNCGPSEYTEVTQMLAARGFTVAVFSHDDNGDLAVANWDAWLGVALDALVAADASNKSPLYFSIDTARLGIVGHSLGAAAAARVASHEKRYKAVALAGPEAREHDFLGTNMTKGIQAALLAFDGSLDEVAPPDQRSKVILDGASSKYKARVVVKDGNHQNCPADFDTDYVRGPGQWVLATTPFWPWVYWKYDFPIIPGLKPIPAAQQRATAFPYLGAWFDRFVAGKASDDWTKGVKADAELQSGVLSEEDFNAAARSGH